MKRKIKALGLLTCFSLSLFVFTPLPCTTIVAHAQSTIIEPYADITEWRYKTENGKLYKRLYNVTSGAWIGDWIYVRDL